MPIATSDCQKFAFMLMQRFSLKWQIINMNANFICTICSAEYQENPSKCIIHKYMNFVHHPTHPQDSDDDEAMALLQYLPVHGHNITNNCKSV